MISIKFSPNELPIKEPVTVTLIITNSGNSSVSKFFLALNFPQAVKFLQGPRRVEIENLAPGETYKISLQLLCNQEGEFFLTSANHSYRKDGVGHRIKDLQVPLRFTVPPELPQRESITELRVAAKPLVVRRKIFVSYSRKDQVFATHMAKSLLQIGYDVWLDVEDIPAGIKWDSAIQRALQSSEIMLVVLSPDSMSSVNVEDEWQYFLDHRKLIIPILWRPCEIHFQLSRLQYVDFASYDFAVSFRKLVTELQRLNI